MNKRIGAAVLAALLLVTGLAGCGRQKDTGSSSEQPSSTSAVSSLSSDGPVSTSEPASASGDAASAPAGASASGGTAPKTSAAPEDDPNPLPSGVSQTSTPLTDKEESELKQQMDDLLNELLGDE